ncbi:translation initiation factor IF-2-like [Vulpes lagopus]|uniref:translation initiation factor IF-2-like n=1 Tax=Vulpes lagopus TaxID=494514 RepID=UPI001BC99C48|nr:translation initiation factor IF-2-like [Vulpes lagopus]
MTRLTRTLKQPHSPFSLATQVCPCTSSPQTQDLRNRNAHRTPATPPALVNLETLPAAGPREPAPGRGGAGRGARVPNVGRGEGARSPAALPERRPPPPPPPPPPRPPPHPAPPARRRPPEARVPRRFPLPGRRPRAPVRTLPRRPAPGRQRSRGGGQNPASALRLRDVGPRRAKSSGGAMWHPATSKGKSALSNTNMARSPRHSRHRREPYLPPSPGSPTPRPRPAAAAGGAGGPAEPESPAARSARDPPPGPRRAGDARGGK